MGWLNQVVTAGRIILFGNGIQTAYSGAPAHNDLVGAFNPNTGAQADGFGNLDIVEFDPFQFGAVPGAQAAAWGMLVASVFIVPLGVAHAGAALLSPTVWWTGLTVAVMSGALPYSLEMLALRRLPSSVFGLLVSASPAVAALVGFVMLGEQLPLLQSLAVACVVAASAGSAWCASASRSGA